MASILKCLVKSSSILAEDMNHPTPFLTNLIQTLRAYSQQTIQSQWKGLYEKQGGSLTTAMKQGDDWHDWELNERHHIAWPQGQVLYLYQRLTVLDSLNSYPLNGLTLRLSLAWWAEDVQLYINGECVQSGDLFDFFTRFCVSESVKSGQIFDVVLRLESPKHDAGALVRSHLIYEAPNHDISPEPGFVADELQVLQYYLNTLAPNKLAVVESLITQEWQASSGELHQRLASLRQCLLPYGNWVKQRQIHCVGHAHLDLAWLWPVADTWQAAERTFESVLTLQQDFPELTYTHSSPALFAWLEVNRPELFCRIQQQVAVGKWSIDAGLWVEPELNIVSGEAIARQLLYGQRYCQEKIGARRQISWLPDTFGFCSQLPQLLKLSGVDVFATQKLRWNDTTQFPHELFRWQAPDGSEVLGWVLPPIGTDFDPLKMAEYAAQWEQQTSSRHACWLPGVGDHGGGPTRDMLLKASRWRESPFFPQVRFSTPEKFLAEAVGKNLLDSSAVEDLPVWDDELYLELHRGCYTAHSDQKQQNRRSEDLLYQAELWAAVAQLVTGQPYPQKTIETAWKKVLFNQFHDILPGSSIPQVFEDANRDWASVEMLGHQVLEQALAALSVNETSNQGQSLQVFNALSWPRTEVVNVVVPSESWKILDCETNQLVESVVNPTHDPFARDGKDRKCQVLSFLASNVPAVGYRVYALVPPDMLEETYRQNSVLEKFVLKNAYLKVVICSETGGILSCIHLETGREIFREPANQLQCFEDSGQYWDAWNIAPDYADKPCAPARLLSIEWISRNDVCHRVRVTRQLNKSTIIHEYSLATESSCLNIETWVDWHETQVVLKVNFPITVESDQATYEVPFGAIERSTNPMNKHEKAKWEVPALRWADISDDTFGLSVLTDCKHGFDAQPDQLRLTLLKAPIWPDPGCDRGHHHFTYAIYPHSGNWQTARTPHQAHQLNIPLKVYQPSGSQSSDNRRAVGAMCHSFLQLEAEHLILSAFKPSETDLNRFIVRYYDAYGVASQKAHSIIATSLGLSAGPSLDLLEEPMICSSDKPYQIYTRQLDPTVE